MVAAGLEAQKAGATIAEDATNEIEHDAKHPELKAALHAGSQMSKQWAQRIEVALQEAGGGQGVNDNLVMQAQYEVSKKVRGQASDDRSRDLGIIASGQLALHYWIAAFGTMRAYLQSMGMTQGAQAMAQCLEEAKQADQQHTDLAHKILSAA